MNANRYSMDGSDFRKLVRGEEVQCGKTLIILSDIGFAVMRDCIDEAERKVRAERNAGGGEPAGEGHPQGGSA